MVLGLPLAFVPVQLLEMLGSPRIGSSQFGWIGVDAASPIYVRGLDPLGTVAGWVMAAGLIAVVPALALLLLRYRRFGADQRRQIQWPLYALSLSAISIVVLSFEPAPPAIPFWLGVTLWSASLLPVRLAMNRRHQPEIEDAIRARSSRRLWHPSRRTCPAPPQIAAGQSY